MLNICITLYEASDYYESSYFWHYIQWGVYLLLLYNKQSQNFLALDSSLLLLTSFSRVQLHATP